eukprot:13655505-Alexandrium_andersonii.AAC.1
MAGSARSCSGAASLLPASRSSWPSLSTVAVYFRPDGAAVSRPVHTGIGMGGPIKPFFLAPGLWPGGGGRCRGRGRAGSLPP